MNSILVLNSSVLGEQSVLGLFVDEAAHRLLGGNPGATVATFVRAEKLGLGPAAREATVTAAKQHLVRAA